MTNIQVMYHDNDTHTDYVSMPAFSREKTDTLVVTPSINSLRIHESAGLDYHSTFLVVFFFARGVFYTANVGAKLESSPRIVLAFTFNHRS